MYLAHIKLAVFDDEIAGNQLGSALATITRKWEPLPVTLVGIGVFPPSALWLAAVPTIDLLTIHTTLHAAIGGYAGDPRYEVGGWLPHVTVGETEFLADATDVLACCWTGPISARLDFLDLVQIETDEIFSSYPLRT
jgi:2'-5' RNA ligase